MLSIRKSFEETRAITVLVVPIGENKMFEKQFDIVSSCFEVPFIELTRPSDWKQQNSPFYYFRWDNGKLLFDFQRYDRFPNGPGDLDNFQSFRRVLVVIGLINYPELGGAASRIEDDLEFYSRRFPHVILRRLFVFNFSFDAGLGTLSVDPKSDPSSLVIFPPEIECESGWSMIDIHLKEVMGNVAVNVFLNIEKCMVQCEDSRKTAQRLPPTVTFNTPFDEADDNLESQWKVRKKFSGRLRKWMGDQCLQISSPGDAFDHYTSAITECRSHSDPLWQAGACEGYATSVLLLLQQGVSPEDILGLNYKPSAGLTPLGAAFKLAEDKANEAILIYSKNSAYMALEVDCIFRVARMFATTTVLGMEREPKVIEFIMKALAVPNLTVQQSSEIAIEGALLCNKLGMKRKSGFFYYLAAINTAEFEYDQPLNQNHMLSHTLFRAASSQYGAGMKTHPHVDYFQNVKVNNKNDNKDIDNNKEEDDYQSLSLFPLQTSSYFAIISPVASWGSMRKILLAQLTYLCRENGDMISAASYMASLLRQYGEIELIKQKQRHLWISSTTTPPTATNNNNNNSTPTPGSTISNITNTTTNNNIPTSNDIITYNFAPNLDDSTSPPMTAFTAAVGAAALRGKTNVTEALAYSSKINNEGFSKRPTQYFLQMASQNSQSNFMINSLTATDTLESPSNTNNNNSNNNSNGGQIKDNGSDDGSIAMSTTSNAVKENTILSNTPLDLLRLGREIKRKITAPKTLPYIQSVEPTLIGLGTFKTKSRSDTSHSITAGTNSTTSTTMTGSGDQVLVSGSSPEEQEGIMRTFDNISSNLPPNSPLVLSGIPVVKSLRPLHLEGSELPMKLTITNIQEKEGDKPSSSLFYDPFAAKRAKDKESSNIEVLWAKKQYSKIVATFRNPLSIPIKLKDVRVIAEGVNCNVNPLAVTLPANAAAYTVILEILPLQEGILKVIGLRYHYNNAVHTALVNEFGAEITAVSELSNPWMYPRRVVGEEVVASSKPTNKNSKSNKMAGGNSEGSSSSSSTKVIGVDTNTIIITPEGTTLRIQPSWGTGSTGNSSLSSSSSPPSSTGYSLRTFLGETRYEYLEIENISTMNVNDIRITVTQKVTSTSTTTTGTTDTIATTSYEIFPFTTVVVPVVDQVNNTNNKLIKKVDVTTQTLLLQYPILPGEKRRVPIIFELPIDIKKKDGFIADNDTLKSWTLEFQIDSLITTSTIPTPTPISNIITYYIRRNVILIDVILSTGVWLENISVKSYVENYQDAMSTTDKQDSHINKNQIAYIQSCLENDHHHHNNSSSNNENILHNVSDLDNNNNNDNSSSSNVISNKSIKILTPYYLLLLKIVNSTKFNCTLTSGNNSNRSSFNNSYNKNQNLIKKKNLDYFLIPVEKIDSQFLDTDISTDSSTGSTSINRNLDITIPSSSIRVLALRLTQSSTRTAQNILQDNSASPQNKLQSILSLAGLVDIHWSLFVPPSGCRTGILSASQASYSSSPNHDNQQLKNNISLPEFEWDIRFIPKRRNCTTGTTNGNSLHTIAIADNLIHEVTTETFHTLRIDLNSSTSTSTATDTTNTTSILEQNRIEKGDGGSTSTTDAEQIVVEVAVFILNYHEEDPTITTLTAPPTSTNSGVLSNKNSNSIVSSNGLDYVISGHTRKIMKLNKVNITNTSTTTMTVQQMQDKTTSLAIVKEFSKSFGLSDDTNNNVVTTGSSCSSFKQQNKLQISFTRSKLYNIYVLVREVNQPAATTTDSNAILESSSVWWTFSEPLSVFALPPASV